MPDMSKPKHAIFVIRYFHPFVGGLEKNTLHLAAGLMARGYRITVMTSRFSPAWPRRESLRGVPVVRLASPKIKVAGALIFLASLAWKLWQARGGATVVHAFQVGYCSALAVAAGRLLRIPTVLTIASSGGGGDIQRHSRTPWGKIFIALCRRADRMVTLNRAMTGELTAAGYPASRIVPCGNGVDLRRYRPPDDPRLARRRLGFADTDRLIVYTGRLAPEKGVDFLIRAFSRLRPAAQAKLVIVGQGPEQRRLETLAGACGAARAVLFTGAADDVAPYLQAADVFVMPSQFEGLSNAILEAMACGVPVIATNVSGNNELIAPGHNGLLVDYNDEASLCGAIASLLGDAGLSARLAGGALDLIRQTYDLEKVLAGYDALYQSLEQGYTAWS